MKINVHTTSPNNVGPFFDIVGGNPIDVVTRLVKE